MDKEDFVTYEQALKLRGLGFNCGYDYYYSKDAVLYKYDYHAEFYDSKSSNNDIPAPTLAQAQKWLREVKNIIVLSTCNLDYKNRHSWYWFIDVNIEVEEPEYSYKTYEEALSAGITECLKFLNNDTDSNK